MQRSTAQLVVLAVAFFSALANEPSETKGTCLLQQGGLRSTTGPLEEEPEEMELLKDPEEDGKTPPVLSPEVIAALRDMEQKKNVPVAPPPKEVAALLQDLQQKEFAHVAKDVEKRTRGGLLASQEKEFAALRRDVEQKRKAGLLPPKDTAEKKAGLLAALPTDIPEDLPEDSPLEVDKKVGGEGETLEEKEKALAHLAEAEGNEDVKAVAGEVESELTNGEAVKEEQLSKLEAGVAEHQSQESLAANGALLTEDDMAKVNGERLEESGSVAASGGVAASGVAQFYEGDMLVSGPEQLALLQDLTRAQANGTSRKWVGAGRPWTNARIPYCFASDVGQFVKNMFRASTRVVMDNLRCMEFVEVALVKGSSTSISKRWEPNFDPTNEGECAEKPAVFVQSDDSLGCFSALGMMPTWKSQSLQLKDPGCTSLGVVVHEIGHALGMHHEHQRMDRDDAINVHMDNVQAGAERWFSKKEEIFTGQPYDILSVMHYGAHSFAADNTKPTITLKDGGTANLGGRGSVAHSDAEQLQEMYKPGKPSCQLTPRTGEGCDDMPWGTCEGITECSQQARRECCACGGGLAIQCFADKPCKPHEIFTGAQRPYLGWVSGGGTLGGWWWGTLEDGLIECAKKPGCKGVTTATPPARAMSGSHYMMFKDHFTVGGDSSSGWSSYRLSPPFTAAPTPAPTR